jgi:hypothetical protein
MHEVLGIIANLCVIVGLIAVTLWVAVKVEAAIHALEIIAQQLKRIADEGSE